MRVYKATYKDRSGKQRKSAKWYLDFSDHNQLRHKIPAFADKRLSEAFGRNIESLVNCRIAGLDLDVKLNQWVETLPDSLLKKFVSWGLIEGQRAEITKPLKEHVSVYIKVLKAKGYIRHTQNRLKNIIDDCRFYYFRDITKSAVEIYVGKLIKDDVSSTTAGHYLDSIKTFLNWAEQDQRIIRNPIAKLGKPDRDSVPKGVLNPEQFVKLIKTTFEKNVLIGKNTGQERAILYLLAGTTGLRKKELLSLAWDDINLSMDNAYVRVKASAAKNDKEAKQPIPPFVVSLLTAFKAATKPKLPDRVFVSFSQSINTAELIRADLATAEISLIDKDGNEICFHSLRNSYISFLANSNTPPKVVQKLARHSDPRLTFNTYARTFEDAEQKAISFLPNFGNLVLSTSLDKMCGKQEISVDNHRHKKGQDTLITAILAAKQTPRVGLEPTT
ncbi:MAG: tyrosine-type recombinase/integrase [Planctomycetes bacterium]|nr:tyrosine-type recombinase/integrase [Planctomycetota bacterium]